MFPLNPILSVLVLFMRAPPRIAREVAKSKRQADPKRNASHLDFVRSLPCVVCGKLPRSEAAHIRVGTDGGMATKPSDKFSVPLCCGPDGCHAKQHRIGEITFWANSGIDPMTVAARLWTVSGDEAQGRRAVARARQAARLMENYRI